MKKEPSNFFDFLKSIDYVKKIGSKYSQRKIARSLLIYAKHTLTKDQYEYVKRKLIREFGIKPRIL